MEGHKEARHRFEVFRDGLKQLGWVEGRNVHFDVRPVGGKREVMQTATAEILALRPDVILANGATVLSTLLQHTRTVPIVFVQVADPVAGGFVTSLAKPGGNVTGFVNFEYAIAGKWVTLLREIAACESYYRCSRSTFGYFRRSVGRCPSSLFSTGTSVECNQRA